MICRGFECVRGVVRNVSGSIPFVYFFVSETGVKYLERSPSQALKTNTRRFYPPQLRD